MSDHKAKAEELLAEAVHAKTGSDIESSRQLQALVHATLEVAEQQRIANLIAFMDAEGGPYKDINNIEGARGLALEQIREGLGLS